MTAWQEIWRPWGDRMLTVDSKHYDRRRAFCAPAK
jgi:hypothetical protein